MKIAYCLNSLDVSGGIERVTCIKANALADWFGHTIFFILRGCNNCSSFRISPKITVITLDVKSSGSKFSLFKERKEHKRKLEKVLKEISPDIVISTGNSEKYILPRIKGKWKTIREMHHEKWFFSRFEMPFFAKIRLMLSYILEYGYWIKKYDKIVVLTEQDKVENWSNSRDVAVIPNPLSFESPKISKLDNKIIISIGRLVEQKNYRSLIRAFNYVRNKYPDWILKIFGDGPLYESLERQINEMGLSDNVFLLGKSSEVEAELVKASVFVLSSVAEGFGVVITEAMSCGVPVVSYDCPCGPKDIIEDGKTGFLVQTGNEKALAEKIIYLIENTEERYKFGHEATTASKKYSIENIVPMWNELFCNLINENRQRNSGEVKMSI